MQRCLRQLSHHRLHRTFATSCRPQVQNRPPPPTPQYVKPSTITKPSTAPATPASAEPQPDLQDARVGPRDPARGYEAAMKAAQTGKLDPRYKPAARRVLAIICAMPLVIVLSYELYQRRFGGKERKRLV